MVLMIHLAIALAVIIAIGLLIFLPWALTYLPGSRSDGEWVKFVLDRTKHDCVYWWEHENRSGIRVLRGRDSYSDGLLHELHIHGFSSKFLYSYSMAGAEEDGYTHNKKQRAYISINPWRPLHQLYKEAIKQLHEEPWRTVQTVISPPAAPLFGLNWGEEPEWRKDA